VSYIIAMGFKVKCVPVLDKMPCCCCSCDLKVATCILGWLSLISHVGSFLRGAVGLAVFADSKDVAQEDVMGIMTGIVVSSAIAILLVALLLYGAHNEKPAFMLPAVIVDMLGIVIVAVAVVVFSVILFFSSFLAGFILLLVGILAVVIASFFWVVIYSYYRKLEEHQYPFAAASGDKFVTG